MYTRPFRRQNTFPGGAGALGGPLLSPFPGEAALTAVFSSLGGRCEHRCEAALLSPSLGGYEEL